MLVMQTFGKQRQEDQKFKNTCQKVNLSKNKIEKEEQKLESWVRTLQQTTSLAYEAFALVSSTGKINKKLWFLQSGIQSNNRYMVFAGGDSGEFLCSITCCLFRVLFLNKYMQYCLLVFVILFKFVCFLPQNLYAVAKYR